MGPKGSTNNFKFWPRLKIFFIPNTQQKNSKPSKSSFLLQSPSHLPRSLSVKKCELKILTLAHL